MSDSIIAVIFTIPLYAALLWIFFDPQGSMFWGKRWMYKEEPELSEDAILYAKVASVISMVLVTVMLVILLF
jgi:hypothetical protein